MYQKFPFQYLACQYYNKYTLESLLKKSPCISCRYHIPENVVMEVIKAVIKDSLDSIVAYTGLHYSTLSINYEHHRTSEKVKYRCFFFISIRTRNGPTGAPFNLSTCGLLQVVAKIWKFYLI